MLMETLNIILGVIGNLAAIGLAAYFILKRK